VTGLTLFLGKEFREILRTYKIWVVPAIFLFFGLLSPVAVKLLPELLKPQMEAQGIVIELPLPKAADSFLQFYKNLAQLGMLAIILVSMGLVSEERSRGILELLLAKPLSRTAVIVSKFVAQTVLVGGSIILGAAACYFYTLALFEGGRLLPFVQGTVLFLAYDALIIALALFFSSVLRSQIAAGGLALISFFLLSTLPLIHRLFAEYSPSVLTSLANDIVAGKADFSAAGWPAVSSLSLTLLLLALGSIIFNRQEL
jgi:ABC-2 type transport system permease protein